MNGQRTGRRAVHRLTVPLSPWRAFLFLSGQPQACGRLAQPEMSSGTMQASLCGSFLSYATLVHVGPHELRTASSPMSRSRDLQAHGVAHHVGGLHPRRAEHSLGKLIGRFPFEQKPVLNDQTCHRGEHNPGNRVCD